MHPAYSILRNPEYQKDRRITSEGIKALENSGMIPRDQLINGAYYIGICRNASIAQWRDKPTWPSKTEFVNNEKSPAFYYMRLKFNDQFVETIKHPADDNGFDCFIPLQIIDTKSIRAL